jgi:hypothetical protein
MSARTRRTTTATVLSAAAALSLAAAPAIADYTPPGLLDCPPAQKKARNGQKPPKALALKLIRCGFERQPSANHYAQKAEVLSYSLGGKRKFRPNINGWGDLGNAKLGTWVWSAKVRWRWTEYRQSETVVWTSYAVWMFYVDVFREWEGGILQSIKDEPVQYLPAMTG